MAKRVKQEYVETVPLSSIKEHPENTNRGDVGMIADLMTENGVYGAIYVQKSSGLIVRGNHSYQAMISHGVESAAVIYLDISDAVAERIMVSDNHSTRAGRDDPVALAELLSKIGEEDAELKGTGYSDVELQDLIHAIESDGHSDAPPEFGSAEPEGEFERRCPKCHYEWNDD